MRRALLPLLLCAACSSGLPTARPPVQAGPSAGLVATASSPSPSPRALPLFDAHIHYSEPAWAILSPEQALERLRAAGVRRAIVSSSPDEGTIRLYELAPDVVVPFLRPYRGEVGSGNWTRDGTTVAYVKARYRA